MEVVKTLCKVANLGISFINMVMFVTLVKLTEKILIEMVKRRIAAELKINDAEKLLVEMVKSKLATHT